MSLSPCCWALWLYICLPVLANWEPRVWLVLPHACEVRRGREGMGDQVTRHVVWLSSWLWKARSWEEPHASAEISAPRRAPLRSSLTSAPVGQTASKSDSERIEPLFMSVWVSFTDLKGELTPKGTFGHHLLTSMLFQTCTVLLYFWYGNQKKKFWTLCLSVVFMQLKWMGSEASWKV